MQTVHTTQQQKNKGANQKMGRKPEKTISSEKTYRWPTDT